MTGWGGLSTGNRARNKIAVTQTLVKPSSYTGVQNSQNNNNNNNNNNKNAAN